MTLVSKNVYIDKLDDLVNGYNNTYHSAIKLKPVKSSAYLDSGIENNDKDPKFEVGDHVRISKYKNIFAKVFTPNCSKEVFVIKKVKNTAPWTYAIEDLNRNKIIETFYQKELQKPNQEEFRIAKAIKKKVIIVC